MFKAALFTNLGCEDTVMKEAKELITCSYLRKEDTVVEIEFTKLLDLCTICYKGQSITRGILLLCRFDVSHDLEKTMKNLSKEMTKCDFSGWIKRYRLDCERHGDHDFKSIDITSSLNAELKGLFKKKYKREMTADFDSPEVIFFTYIYEKKGYFGVDFAGFDLAKRQYKIFNHPESLKGITGYHLIRETGLEKGVILDPFMGSGVIVIEAGLFSSKFPVQFYNREKLAFMNLDFFLKEKERFFTKNDKTKKESLKIFGYDCQFKYLKACQKNAKLAGIEKSLCLSRIEAEWLDTKFEKSSVDAIVTDPPRESKNKDEKMLRKLYSEFFHNAEYILKKKGKMILIAIKFGLLDETAKNNKFKKTGDNLIFQGKESFHVLTYEKV